jgi:hypothetical protein
MQKIATRAASPRNVQFFPYLSFEDYLTYKNLEFSILCKPNQKLRDA